MTYSEILSLLKKNKVDTYDAMVATSCDSAWGTIKHSKIKQAIPSLTYDMFCNTCENLWLDCEEDTGLTAIADLVANYLIIHKRFPEEIIDII